LNVFGSLSLTASAVASNVCGQVVTSELDSDVGIDVEFELGSDVEIDVKFELGLTFVGEFNGRLVGFRLVDCG